MTDSETRREKAAQHLKNYSGDYGTAYRILAVGMTEEEKTRVGHEDRTRYTDHLNNMLARGYLSPDEWEQRRDSAMQAVYLSDLNDAVLGLPAIPPVPKPEIKTRMVRQSVIDKPFSPLRWFLFTLFPFIVAVCTGPISASMAHGFDNGPWQGSMAILLIAAGILGTVVTGFALAPTEVRKEVRE